MVSLFVDWLYRGKLQQGYNQADYHNIINLYILAEKIWNLRLANDSMDKIRGLAWDSEQVPSYPIFVIPRPEATRMTIGIAEVVYEKTRRDSPLREYCIRRLGVRFGAPRTPNIIRTTINDFKILHPLCDKNVHFLEDILRRRGLHSAYCYGSSHLVKLQSMFAKSAKFFEDYIFRMHAFV